MVRMLCRGLVLGLSLVLFASTASANDAAAREHYKRGMAAFYLDHFDEAIAEVGMGFGERRQPAFLYICAQSLARAGRPRQAVVYYEKYLQLSPEDGPDRPEVQRRVDELKRQPEPKLASPPLVPLATAQKPGTSAP